MLLCAKHEDQYPHPFHSVFNNNVMENGLLILYKYYTLLFEYAHTE